MIIQAHAYISTDSHILNKSWIHIYIQWYLFRYVDIYMHTYKYKDSHTHHIDCTQIYTNTNKHNIYSKNYTIFTYNTQNTNNKHTSQATHETNIKNTTTYKK